MLKNCGQGANITKANPGKLSKLKQFFIMIITEILETVTFKGPKKEPGQ